VNIVTWSIICINYYYNCSIVLFYCIIYHVKVANKKVCYESSLILYATELLLKTRIISRRLKKYEQCLKSFICLLSFKMAGGKQKMQKKAAASRSLIPNKIKSLGGKLLEAPNYASMNRLSLQEVVIN